MATRTSTAQRPESNHESGNLFPIPIFLAFHCGKRPKNQGISAILMCRSFVSQFPLRASPLLLASGHVQKEIPQPPALQLGIPRDYCTSKYGLVSQADVWAAR